MTNIEEMKVENDCSPKIDEIRINNRVYLTKIFFGSGDDNFITISGNDASIYMKFVKARSKFLSLADDLDNKELAIREKYKGKEDAEISDEDMEKILGLYKNLYEESKGIMDGVFGEGTTEKFWKDVFDSISDFIPTMEAWMDYFDSLIPVVEKMSSHSERLEKLSSMKRMAKYQPQDYKRKGAK